MSEKMAPPVSPDGHWWWDGTVWQPIASLPRDSASAGDPTAAAVPARPAVAAAPAGGQAQDSWPAWLPRNPTVEAVLVAAAEQQPSASLGRFDKKAIHRQREEAEKQERKAERERARSARTSRPPGPRLHLAPPKLSERGWILTGLVALGTMTLLGTFVETISHGHHSTPGAALAANPPPSKSGSERARADRFITYSLTPAVTEAAQAMAPLGMDCNTAFSRTCQDAINAADVQLQMSMTTIDRGAAPNCLSEPAKKVRADLQAMHDALRVALAGFPSNNHDGVAAGVAKALAAGQPLAADNAAATAARASCAH